MPDTSFSFDVLTQDPFVKVYYRIFNPCHQAKAGSPEFAKTALSVSDLARICTVVCACSTPPSANQVHSQCTIPHSLLNC